MSLNDLQRGDLFLEVHTKRRCVYVYGMLLVTRDLGGWRRQGFAGKQGPPPDTVVKAGGKEIVLGWGDRVRLQRAKYQSCT